MTGNCDKELIYTTRGAILDVYDELGTGLLESAYKTALFYQLDEAGLEVVAEKAIPLIFHGHKLDYGFRADLIVNNKIIIEIKSTDALANIHHLQLITYIRLSGIPHGLLVNFNTDEIMKNLHYWNINKIRKGNSSQIVQAK